MYLIYIYIKRACVCFEFKNLISYIVYIFLFYYNTHIYQYFLYIFFIFREYICICCMICTVIIYQRIMLHIYTSYINILFVSQYKRGGHRKGLNWRCFGCICVLVYIMSYGILRTLLQCIWANRGVHIIYTNIY